MKMLMFFGVLSLMDLCQALMFPSNFQKCDKSKPDFNECLSEAVHGAIRQLNKPMEEYGLPSFEPFFLAKFLPSLGRKVDFQQVFKNYRIFGRTKISKSQANMNFQDKTLTIALTHPEIKYFFDYEAKGKMFLLPIDTAGAATVLSRNVTYVVTFTFQEYTKNDKTHWRVINTNLMMQPQEVVALFENLFEDKDLNDGFSRAMSHKWREILEELLSIYVDYYGKAYGEVFDNFLSIS
ncbi:protein takeout-like isoform X2 [Tenebrio molitor]|uniref:protein takeout-like isoform X2 n=1 Tax=Tenebrio molitor TaxID=7067 RepID=UPI0036248BDB